MIPSDWRRKGGALLLGAEVHGDPGPFGTWTEGDDQEDADSGDTDTAPHC